MSVQNTTDNNVTENVSSVSSSESNNVTENVSENTAENLEKLRKNEALKYERERKLKEELESSREKLSQYEQMTQKIIENGYDLNSFLNYKNPTLQDNSVEQTKLQLEEAKRLTEELRQQRDEIKKYGEIDKIKKFIETNSDRYELINEFGLHDQVNEHITRTFKKEKKVLTYEESADIIEKHLEKEFVDYSAKAKNTKKMRKYFSIEESNKESDNNNSKKNEKSSNEKPKQTATTQKTQTQTQQDKPKINKNASLDEQRRSFFANYKF